VCFIDTKMHSGFLVDTRCGILGICRQVSFSLSWWVSAVTSRETTKHRQHGVTREGHESQRGV